MRIKIRLRIRIALFCSKEIRLFGSERVDLTTIRMSITVGIRMRIWIKVRIRIRFRTGMETWINRS